MEINWAIVIAIIIILVSLDKLLTVVNIKAVEKNYPEVDRLSIERNPLAKNFFIQYGLVWGTALYWLFSVLTFLIALGLLSWCLSMFKVTNYFSISLWILMIFYGFVIMNNLFFALKFNGVIP